jgi:HEAT repeat protein
MAPEAATPGVPTPPDGANSDGDDDGGRGWTLAVWGLSGAIVFLLLLIAAVLAARHLRPALVGPRSDPGPRTLDDWIARLRDGPDEAARRQAGRAVVERGPEAVAAALAAVSRILDDGNVLDLDRRSVRALAESGEAVVPALAESLGSPRAEVRVAAAAVLREMGPEAAPVAEALGAALGDENRWVRWYAADGLARLGPAAAPAIEPLIQVLDHPDRYTRRRATVALGRIGPGARQAAARLEALERDDEDRSVREAAATALSLVNLDALAAAGAARASEQVQELIARLQEEDEFESVSAARELAQLGREARDAVPALARALHSGNKWLRVAAAEALGAMGRDARSVAAALEQALEDEDADVRAAAEAALERIAGRPRGG